MSSQSTQTHITDAQRRAEPHRHAAPAASETLRTAPRSSVFLSASVDGPIGPQPARLRNLSRTGALVEGEDLPSCGQAFELQRDHRVFRGRLVWKVDRRAGMMFDEPLDEGDPLLGPTAPRKVAVSPPSWAPRVSDDFRRPGFGRRGTKS